MRSFATFLKIFVLGTIVNKLERPFKNILQYFNFSRSKVYLTDLETYTTLKKPI